MSEEKLTFQAEVAKLLDIVVHSLYSNTEIFLRELISNASDSCDRLRYAALTQQDLLTDGGSEFAIHIDVNKENHVLTIRDNGIGMNREDLIENLGTIAKSGTGEFMKSLTGDSSKDVSLIGQFGVGFYSSFMVAKKVEVFSRKAGESQGWHWTSDGKGSFRISEADNVERGARIVLHLRKDSEEFLEPLRLRTVVKTYSDHIALPVILDSVNEEGNAESETLNSASALWTRPKNEITEEQYTEFYHHVAHGFDEPWQTLHFRAEGAIEYTGLLFIPTNRPFDLFEPDRKSKVKLYVNRVFISDELDGLLPSYLRFVRGIVDSSDLPLNVSREMLQENPLLQKIQKGLVSRLLKELKKRSDDAESYQTFWNSFGAVLKEGLYEDFNRRDELLELCRFQTTESESLRSLKSYVENLKDGQTAIYYITGDDAETLSRAPQLEVLKAKGVEVLLLTDPVDEFWVQSIGKFEEHEFRSTASALEDIDQIAGEQTETEESASDEDSESGIEETIDQFKAALGDAVKDVRASNRLRESAVCLVGEDGGMSLHLERMLKQHGQGSGMSMPRVLEINPKHPLIRKLAGQSEEIVAETAHLLLDQARIIEGEAVPDPTAFAKRLAQAVERALV